MPFLKIFLLIYLSYTLPSSAERRAGEDRANNGTTPRQQKVLFVNICHRYWLFSARGYPHEKSPPFFVHYPEYYSGHPCIPATCCVFASGLANNLVPILSSRSPSSWLSCSAGSPITLVALWGALCASARENFPTSTPYSLRPPLKKSP